MDWLLGLGLKEGLVECATVCIKSEVIISYMFHLTCAIKKLLILTIKTKYLKLLTNPDRVSSPSPFLPDEVSGI